MRRLLCWLGFHKWVSYKFNFNEWWTGTGITVTCSCGVSRPVRTLQGMELVRNIVNNSY